MRRALAVFLVAAGGLLAIWLCARPIGVASRTPAAGEVAASPQTHGRWSLAAGAAPQLAADSVVVEGRVIEHASGTPVAGATVMLAGVASAEAVSADDGTFQLVAPRKSRGRLVARHGRWFGRGAMVDLDEEPPPQLIALQPASAVSGRVLDGEGTPIAGAEVHVYAGAARWRADREDAEPLVDQRTLSKPDGTYLIEGVPGGAYRIDARAGGYAARKSMILVEENDVVEDFMLPRAAHLSGRVVGARGQPLHAPAILFLSAREQTVTDEQGGFDFAELPPGIFSVYAFDASLGSAQFEVDLQAGDARTVTIELKEGAVIEGSVRHADGRAASGAMVRMGRRVRVRADDQGRYRIAGLRAGPYEITVGEGVDVLATMEVGLREDEHRSGVDFTLAEGRHAVAGVVVDASGQPVPNEDLTLRIGDLKRRVRCDGDGRFHADGLPDGGGEVSLYDGYEMTGASFSEDDADVRVVLKRRALLRGTVAGGRPLAGFTVELTGGDGVDRTRQFSDAAGRFVLEGVTPGHYRVEVSVEDGSSGAAELDVGDAPVSDVSIRLDPPGEVRGRVVDRNGRPRPNVTVDDGVHHAQTGPDGRFRLTVRPGTLELSFSPDDEEVVADSRKVAVAAGAQVDVGAVTLLDRRAGGDEEHPGYDGMEAENLGGQATVASVEEGSSAARAGIVPGDLLFAIDGNDVSSLGGAAIDELLRGTAGTTVEVTFAHPDAEAQTVSLLLTGSTQPND